MWAFVLILPLLLVRFVLLGGLSKEALGRAQVFAPLNKTEKGIMVPYQLSNLFLLFYPLTATFQVGSPPFWGGLLPYLLGGGVLVLSVISFAKPDEQGFNREGIYTLSRNPMYVGYHLFFLGCALIMGSVGMGIAWVVFVLTTHFVILSEERWCLLQFGHGYRTYMQRVRRYI